MPPHPRLFKLMAFFSLQLFFLFNLKGRVNSSSIVSELIYTLSNLLVLFNDRIIEKSKTNYTPTDRSKYKLKLLLTTLEYSEVFIELSAKKLWGESGRWLFITIVQLVKCIGRFVLRFYHADIITQNPPIVPFDRKNIERTLAERAAEETFGEEAFDARPSQVTFKLKRSGRIVRKIEGSPPIYLRSWKSISSNTNDIPVSIPMVRYQKLTSAEVLYIVKPLLHLGSAGLFGIKSWKSYSFSLAIDLISLRMYQKNINRLSPKQRLELSRRTVALLLYLMRSPFYEKFTQRKLTTLLKTIADVVPFSSTICNPLLEYIPQWQQTYFYMWSS